MHRHFLYSDRAEAPRQTVHHIAYLSEHPHATRPSFDMLEQSAERAEIAAALHLWAPVYPLGVGRAYQVSIEVVELIERGVAQEALERRPIPRARRSPRWRTHRSLVPSRPTDQPRWVGDNTVSVELHDEAVELRACHARRAGARLEVERECSSGDKGSVAAIARARDIARPMLLRAQVLLEVVLILETPAALGAIVVHLVVMFLESRIAIE
jgi:hypothetical protein